MRLGTLVAPVLTFAAVDHQFCVENAAVQSAEDRAREVFARLAIDSPEEFWNCVSDDVERTVPGARPLAGRYVGKAQFRQVTFAWLSELFYERPRLQTRSVLADGYRAAVELYARGVAKSGIRFDNHYCWVCRFQDEETVSVQA